MPVEITVLANWSKLLPITYSAFERYSIAASTSLAALSVSGLLIFLSSTAFERILIELSIAGVGVMLMVSPVISFSFRLIATK